ncbi:hypothetical protein ACF0H5_010949 [Mactra antiquata]
MLAARRYQTESYEKMYPLTHRERAAVIKCDMDSLPTPQGAWLANYQADQKKKNMHVVASFVLLFGSLFAGYTYNFFSDPDIKKPINLEEVFQQRKANCE